MQKRHQSSQDLAEVENRPERRNPSDLSGLVELDAQKIQDQMRHCRTSKSELAIKAKVSRRTIDSVLEHGRCQARVAYSVAKALKLPGHEDLMPDADHETASATMPSKKRTIGEWVVLGKPTAWKSLSNGLQYKVWKMERRLVPGSFGRGKCYDLERMSDEERAETERRLMRHPAICDGIGRHPAIPTNKHAGFEGKNHFWVIDVWEEGPSLSEVLKQGPLEPDRLPKVMRQIAEGLRVLHENEIARRELTPDFVILRASDHSVLLTDLELARLLDGSPPTGVPRSLRKSQTYEVHAAELNGCFSILRDEAVFATNKSAIVQGLCETEREANPRLANRGKLLRDEPFKFGFVYRVIGIENVGHGLHHFLPRCRRLLIGRLGARLVVQHR